MNTYIEAEWSGIERRESAERRTCSLQTLRQCISAPRRTKGRRTTDRRYPIVDHFDSGILLLAILLMGLSIADSIFTLTLISRGGSELNPIMNWFLGHSVWAFIIVKMILTGIPAVLLVATGNVLLYKRWRARSILGAMVGLYAGLIVYELSLLSLG